MSQDNHGSFVAELRDDPLDRRSARSSFAFPDGTVAMVSHGAPGALVASMTRERVKVSTKGAESD